MQDSNLTAGRGEMEKLSTRLLDQMLQAELQSDDGDPKAVQQILDVLKAREKNMPVEINENERKAWKKYKARTGGGADKPGKMRIWLLRAACAVLILIAVMTSVSNEVAAGAFWERVARWSDSVFGFFNSHDPSEGIEEYVFQTDHPGLQQVYDAVSQEGVTMPAVPMWLPEGYTLFYCQKFSAGKKTTVLAAFQSGEKVINFNVDIYAEDALNQYQKDETQIKVFECQGIKHHIVKNNDMWVAVWSAKNIECSLSIDCQEDELYRIIRSIYDKEEAK